MALASLFIPVYPETINEVYQASLEQKISPKEMLNPNEILSITKKFV